MIRDRVRNDCRNVVSKMQQSWLWWWRTGAKSQRLCAAYWSWSKQENGLPCVTPQKESVLLTLVWTCNICIFCKSNRRLQKYYTSTTVRTLGFPRLAYLLCQSLRMARGWDFSWCYPCLPPCFMPYKCTYRSPSSKICLMAIFLGYCRITITLSEKW